MNYHVITCCTNIIDRDGEHSSRSARYTTSSTIKATSIFEDQCAVHERVKLESFEVTVNNRNDPQLIQVRQGGLS